MDTRPQTQISQIAYFQVVKLQGVIIVAASIVG